MTRPRLLWDKGGVAPDAAIQRFLAGEDVVLDRALFLHDVAGTRAHVRGLGRIGVLSEADTSALVAALDLLAEEWRTGRFVLDERYEDGHSAIEAFVVEKLGDVGKRVHTARSRNDQVQTALRLYMKDRLGELARTSAACARALLDRVAKDGAVPMPGYTHLQRAVPSSVGIWFGGLAEAFVDDADLALATRTWIDACPLGTAAGYGVNLPLDRDGVAQELGFARLVVSPVYAQNARGKAEIAVLAALGQALLDVRRLAWDLSLFTTAEFAFVKLPDAYTTGSSLMPNKRNPDVVELLRASYGSVLAAQVDVATTLSLPSGYQRDLQATKGPFVTTMARGLAALALVPRLVRDLTFDEQRMRAAITRDTFATDRAVSLAAGGTPFRDAYRQVAEELGDPSWSAPSPEESLRARVSPGGAADLRTDVVRARLDALPLPAAEEPGHAAP